MDGGIDQIHMAQVTDRWRDNEPSSSAKVACASVTCCVDYRPPPYTADVTNRWSFTSAPPTRLQGVVDYYPMTKLN